MSMTPGLAALGLRSIAQLKVKQDRITTLEEKISGLEIVVEDFRLTYAALYDEYAQLEQENADLWAYVKAEDAFYQNGEQDDWEEGDRLYLAYRSAREALRKYETTDEPDGDDFGVCDECGEPLLFASIGTCANCVEAHHS